MAVLDTGVLSSTLSDLAARIAAPELPFPPLLPPGTLSIIHTPGVLVFKLNGVTRWTIDIRRFGGSPALSMSGALPHAVEIQLKHALFPGTQLPADFTCTLKARTIFGTPILKFVLGGSMRVRILSDG